MCKARLGTPDLDIINNRLTCDDHVDGVVKFFIEGGLYKTIE